MSSAVRLAAMIPATCAVARASPLGSARSRAAVSGAMRTNARARAGRRSLGLPPTSTMCTLPASSTCVRPSFPGISDGESSAGPARRGFEILELGLDPSAHVVLAYLLPDRVQPGASLPGRKLEG